MADKLIIIGVNPVRVRDDDRLEIHVQEMDVTLSSLRDALQGIGVRDLSTVQTAIEQLLPELREQASEGQLVLNGDVEEGEGDSPAGWNKSAAGAAWDATEGYLSSKCLRLNIAGASADWRSATFLARAGGLYLFRARVKGTGDADTKLTLRCFDAADVFLGEQDVVLSSNYTDWTEVRGYFLAPANTAKGDLMFRVTGAGTADIKGDRFSAKEV